MTVAELIEKLRELPGEAVVLKYDDERCESFPCPEPTFIPNDTWDGRDYSRSKQGRIVAVHGPTVTF